MGRLSPPPGMRCSFKRRHTRPRFRPTSASETPAAGSCRKQVVTRTVECRSDRSQAASNFFVRNFLLDVLFFVNAVWSIRHRSGRREPQADDDSGSVGPCPSYPLRLACSENPLSGCVGLGFERHLMPQPFLGIGPRPAGHGSHRHDRHEGRFSWVWKPGTGMQTVLSALEPS